MKTTVCQVLAVLAAFQPVLADENDAAFPAERLAEGDAAGWRVSVGVRSAPSVKTKATLDVPAVLRQTGRVSAFGRSSSSTVSETVPGTGAASGSGRTKDEALATAARKADGSYEFDNGYIRPDSAGVDGETWNWHFDGADAFSAGVLSGTTAFGSGDGASSTTTHRETRTALSETVAAGFSDTSDTDATGFDVELARTLWSDGRFGVELQLGWTVYGDLDVFRMGGRAYEGRASSRVSTETTTTTSGSSGSVVTAIPVDASFDIDYATNPDGSLGGASYDGLPSQPGWGTPLLVFDPQAVSTSVSESGSGEGGTTAARSASPAKNRSRTVDVFSRGELSMQDVRIGISPFCAASNRFSLRGKAGLLGTYAQVETSTAVVVDGLTSASSSHADDDWKFQGYAGVDLAWRVMSGLELSAGADVRFPSRRIRFGDGIVSGSVELPKWDAVVLVSIEF